MHERKALMAELADAFVALPGGIGTLEELVEMLTWAQLGLHAKPIGIVNVDGYYDGLLAFLEHAVGEGFLSPATRERLTVDRTRRRCWMSSTGARAPPTWPCPRRCRCR